MNLAPIIDPQDEDPDQYITTFMLRGALTVAEAAARELQVNGVDANGEPLIENPTYRIGGIGVGTVTLVTVFILYCLICCAGSFVKNPFCMYCWATFFTVCIVTFLFFAERTTKYKQTEEVVNDTDEHFNERLFLGLWLGWCSLLTICGFMTHFVSQQVFAEELEITTHNPNGKARPIF